jgi:hypothetical protein
MRSKTKKRRLARRKTKLGLPDLDHAKAAVLASLCSPESQRSYRHAIEEFTSKETSLPVSRPRSSACDKQPPGTLAAADRSCQPH